MSEYVDDASVSGDEKLWRNIPPWHIVRGKDGKLRASSAAFCDSEDGSPMSVTLQSLAYERGLPAESAIKGLKGFALAAITAGLARSRGQGIQRDPVPENPAHALVFGKKTKSTRTAFAVGATWVIQPPGIAVSR